MKQIRLIVLTALTICTSVSWAQMDGEGTEKNPYQVKTPEDLFDVRMDLSANYKLMNDIDLTEWIQEESPKQGWTPIGTETIPFTGTFDGNNKSIKGLFINRTNSDNVGLFGYINGATIKKLCLINPIIIGNNSVGSIVGGVYSAWYYYISDNICVGGKIEGSDYIGGIVGRISGCGTSSNGQNICYLKGNSFSGYIKGNNNCGGIVGEICGYHESYHTAYTHIEDYCYPKILDNHFEGIVNANTNVGGIAGWADLPVEQFGSLVPRFQMEIMRNLAQGVIKGKESTNGILGIKGILGYRYIYLFDFLNNICAADTIIGDSSYRIYSEEYPDNYALVKTIVVRKGKVVEVEDNNYNGSSLGLKSLMRQNTYVGMGFDFDDQWAISEGTSFPYNINQCSPPTISSCVSSNTVTKITGTAQTDGIIYVFAGEKMYEGKIVGGIWEVTANVPLPVGTIVRASADTENNMPSIFATYKVTKEESELEKCATPTITYDRGHLIFACSTPGAKIVSKVMTKDAKESTEAELTLSLEYTITIYATAEGFADSDAVTTTLHFGDANLKAEGIIVVDTEDLRGDMNQDGVVNITDITYIVKKIMGTSH